ncbi:conserved unknown protein [Ectocarpus siliculosus]|uniref:Uncharacterized protein n=1 Tax=Ectocarpus siliculosus TaxID=2880 RepID=D8LD73_ECTSI|nr:conserved unknown protein [Ectocarpus siliculosus]|eukprot:CBN75526.1 conserved unknown protein [Ectocarpus siliculosus]
MIALSVMACCCCYSDVKPFGPIMVTAFRASPPPRTSSKKRFENSGLKSQQMDATPLKEALELIAMETSGSRRVTKKALLESIGYGVMDPLAYQTFENSPLPPKLRPTTHVRIADGIHTFGQEFLGVPPEEGVSSFSEYAVAGSSASETTAHSSGDGTDPSAVGGSQQFELQPKLPGLGMRMTMLRLGSGELLAHSPVAPTVELLDMLRDCFPAVGPTTKVHLFSASVSPEHWAFLKHWKAIFPAAEVWAVPGPHRRLVGVEVDHDIEQISGVPERLGGEVEVAVLEGVPMVREALLLHRPTGTVLSADLLLAMDPSAIAAQDAAAGGEGQRPEPTSSATAFSPPGESPTTSSSLRPKRFGEHSGSLAEVETSPDSEKKGGGSRWRRLRWGILDKTASLLDMNTLAVFAPVKTLLHAFKGNSGAFSSRVLSWDTKVLVACHGQSPLEGPELKGMLHAALGRQPAEPGRSSPAVTAAVAEPPEQQAANAPSAGGAGMPGKDKAAGGVSPWSRRLPTTSGANGADNVLGGLRVSAGEGGGETMLEAEARARRYVRDKLAGDGAGAAEFVAPPESPKAARGRAFGGERKPAPSARTGEGLGPGQTTPPAKVERQQPAAAAAAAAGDVRDKGEAGGAGAEGGDNPFVVGADTRYDEGPVGPIGEADDDPFEAPFYPFDADGPPLNGRALQ